MQLQFIRIRICESFLAALVFELDAGIENLSNSKLVELLLYGNPLLYPKNVNASILKLTISYLMNTERFDCPLL